MPAAAKNAKEKPPKNEKVDKVILLIGDGMGLASTAVWMIDQNYAPTAFDRAQFVGIQKTYSLNSMVTDSGAGGTAIATGSKTNNSMIAMLPDGTELKSIAQDAKEAGKPVGIVVSSYVQDATPSAFYAHAKSRGDFGKITEDLIAFKPDVIIGGGRAHFSLECPEGTLMDRARAEGITIVETPEEFLKTDKTPVFGLIAENGYPGVIERDSDYLVDAMNHSLDLFSDSKKGFFLMVEGSHIDHACHANNAEQLVFEMEEFDKAVNAAFDYADAHKGTLVIVTADHETGGVYLPAGDKDYHKGNTGVQTRFGWSGHTAIPVVVYAYGASSWKFSGVLDNTDIAKRIRSVVK
jgi:Alkaline phosphatase